MPRHIRRCSQAVVACFTLFICSSLMAQTGTLSGRVVDEDNPSQGIPFVDVDLLDPATGEIPVSYYDRTNVDGFYEITDVPLGQYKVLFNAVGDSDVYVDELYNDVPCDNGGCDRRALGDAITISDSSGTLNVSLPLKSSLSTLSGRITDSRTGAGISPVAIDLMVPDSGVVTGLQAITDSQGYYQITGIEPGDYKVSFNAYDSANRYADELYNDISCDNIGCNRASLGSVFSITASENTLNEELANSTPVEPPPTSGSLTDEQLAAVVTMLMRPSALSGTPVSIPVSDFSFNYDPRSDIIATASAGDAGNILLTGTKTNTGDIEFLQSISVTGGLEDFGIVELTLDEDGFPAAMTSPYGNIDFQYSNDNLTLLTTGPNGETSTLDVAFSAADRARILDTGGAAQSSYSCDVDENFALEDVIGFATFACDNSIPTIEATPSLRMVLEERPPAGYNRGRTIARPTLEFANNTPGLAESQTEYLYTLRNYKVVAPRYEDWRDCCGRQFDFLVDNRLNNTLRALQEIENRVREALGPIEELVTVASCIANPEACARDLLRTFFNNVLRSLLGLPVDEEDQEPDNSTILDRVRDDVVARYCSRPRYEIETANPSTDELENVQVVFEKQGVKGGWSFFTLGNQAFPVDNPPDFTVGPAPVDFLSRDGLTNIRVLDASDNVLSQSNGEVTAELEIGSRLTFRAFDQFFDRSGASPFSLTNRLNNQHYACGTYRWVIRRQGQSATVFDTIQAIDSDRVTTPPLELGTYTATLTVSNLLPSNGVTRRYYIGDQETATPEAVSETITFRVGSDDDLIREHLVGTWDIYHDGAYRIGGPYENNTYGICPYSVPGVSFSNYFYPEETLVNLNVSTRPEHRITLNADGTGTFRFYNFDSSNPDPVANCALVLDEDAESIRWSVRNGVVNWAGRRGHLTVERIEEKGPNGSYMSIDDWDFATGTRDITDRYRWERLPD